MGKVVRRNFPKSIDSHFLEGKSAIMQFIKIFYLLHMELGRERHYASDLLEIEWSILGREKRERKNEEKLLFSDKYRANNGQGAHCSRALQLQYPFAEISPYPTTCVRPVPACDVDVIKVE